jgi:uncharacterized protein (DUF1800 family)
MTLPSHSAAVGGPWTRYVPDAKAPWCLRRVVHLHRRAGFAATWDEVQRDLKDGPERAVTRLLTGGSRGEGVPENFAATADTLARAAVASGDLARLKAWWVYRMLFGPDPLGERLALFWHNHFATRAAKAGPAVRGQNDLFRRLGRGPFGELLNAVARDPALLLYLDAQANRRGNPNENLARELLELFTLGIGHYTEADVKEAARALTGWTVGKGRFRVDDALHDAGEKTILGRKGAWKGDDLLRLLLEHPATADRLAARLCEFFLGEGAVDMAGVRALAAGLRERDLDVGWAVETVLRSRAFFAEANLGTRVLGPAEYVVGAARALELLGPAPSTLVLAEFIANLGQDLFHPPNVGGWPGGRAWLSTRAAVGRCNYAAALLDGDGVGLPEAPDVLALTRRHGRGRDWEDLVSFFAELLLGGVPSRAWRERLLAALGPGATLDPATARRAAALVLSCPESWLA